MKKTKYIYDAAVTNIVDGDTVDVLVDLGFKTFKEMRFRLFGLDAPELRKPEREAGEAAKTKLMEMILGENVVIYSHKDKTGKYGRYLATIYLEDGTNVNEKLIYLGHAKRVQY